MSDTPTPGPEGLREQMARNRDPRALRTRQRLVKAFRETLEAGEDPLGVSAITRRAGVNRTSFYAHFSGPEALAVEALTEVFAIVGSLDAASRHDVDVSAMATSTRSLAAVIAFVGAHRATYRHLLGDGRNAFALAVEDAFASSTVATLRVLPDVPEGVDPEVVSRFVAAGVMGVVAWWLRRDEAAGVEELAGQLAAVLPPWFTKASTTDEGM